MVMGRTSRSKRNMGLLAVENMDVAATTLVKRDGETAQKLVLLRKKINPNLERIQNEVEENQNSLQVK